jgi:hypothetical protein
VSCVAAGTAAASSVPAIRSHPPQQPQDRPDHNPSTLTGMRGSHPGSFEAAHALRDGTFPKTGTSPIDTGEHYDLIVVGGGISGLVAAYFYRAAAGGECRYDARASSLISWCSWVSGPEPGQRSCRSASGLVCGVRPRRAWRARDRASTGDRNPVLHTGPRRGAVSGYRGIIVVEA